MEYLLANSDLHKVLKKAEAEILNAQKHKFQRMPGWRNEVVPDYPGIYALYEKVSEKFSLLYVGETGKLRERMDDICRTVNHTFRKQLGFKRFNIPKPGKKRFDDKTEKILDAFFDEHLYVSFLEVNFGRTEIETYMVTKYQKQLFNSEKKRKLKLILDEFENKT